MSALIADVALTDLPGAAPARWARVDATQWLAFAQRQRAAGGTLLALWGSDDRDRDGTFSVWAAYLEREGIALVQLPATASPGSYPSLAPVFCSAERMERALRDMFGLDPAGARDQRPWLRHAAWPADAYPLRRDFVSGAVADAASDAYDFVRVHGEGVHEIPVGPVHAGIIEPGHFRFSVVGEKVLRLEQRLGYTHKGTEKRFEALPLREGHRLAARVSGDSAVAFSWAYCMALESLAGSEVPTRAAHLRALALERERLANHLGDLGALGNDAGFAFGLAQFSRLKEDLLRVNELAWAQRYLMDEVVPGGVAHDLSDAARRAIAAQSLALETEVARLRAIYGDHAGVQDRFVACGQVTPALAVTLGLVGLPARASGQARDLRCDSAHAPYDRLRVNIAMRSEGDVAARVAVRFDEIRESLRLCREIVDALPDGAIASDPESARTNRIGVGAVECWRGPVLVALEAGADGRVRRCHPHDPSWQNWPALEHAVIDNIVPDFPLINKSFNLSYSGHDL